MEFPWTKNLVFSYSPLFPMDKCTLITMWLQNNNLKIYRKTQFTKGDPRQNPFNEKNNAQIVIIVVALLNFFTPRTPKSIYLFDRVTLATYEGKLCLLFFLQNGSTSILKTQTSSCGVKCNHSLVYGFPTFPWVFDLGLYNMNKKSSLWGDKRAKHQNRPKFESKTTLFVGMTHHLSRSYASPPSFLLILYNKFDF